MKASVSLPDIQGNHPAEQDNCEGGSQAEAFKFQQNFKLHTANALEILILQMRQTSAMHVFASESIKLKSQASIGLNKGGD